VGVFEPPLSIKGRYAVTQDNIVKFAEPGTFKDPLTEVLRSGARKLLAQAIEAEISDFLDRNSGFFDRGRPAKAGSPRAFARARDHDPVSAPQQDRAHILPSHGCQTHRYTLRQMRQ
jgi:hypothetical protein